MYFTYWGFEKSEKRGPDDEDRLSAERNALASLEIVHRSIAPSLTAIS